MKHLEETRQHYKECIVSVITQIYIKHTGNLPDWSADEEISVENSEIGVTSRITVDCGVTQEKWTIEEYRVNVSGDLFFWCETTLEEVHWTEVSTDELVRIYTNLNNYWTKIK